MGEGNYNDRRTIAVDDLDVRRILFGINNFQKQMIQMNR